MPLSPTLRWLLLLPAAALLTLVFVLPLIWFLAGSLAELGTAPDIIRETATIIASRAMQQSLAITAQIALATTLLCLLIGFPLAYLLLHANALAARLAIACILLPYLTSVIVRTYAWMVLLGRTGLINQALQATGLTTAPLQLLYNRAAVIVGMTYVLLPYMVLTLYSAMRAIDRRLLQAAALMGASPARIFCRVFLPLVWHGVVAGSLLVFILAAGFFITPALMGAPGDLMVGILIQRQIELADNWPVAAIMSLVLLAATLLVYAVYTRLADPKRALPA